MTTMTMMITMMAPMGPYGSPYGAPHGPYGPLWGPLWCCGVAHGAGRGVAGLAVVVVQPEAMVCAKEAAGPHPASSTTLAWPRINK